MECSGSPKMSKNGRAGVDADAGGGRPIVSDEAEEFLPFIVWEDNGHAASVDDEAQVLHAVRCNPDKFVLR